MPSQSSQQVQEFVSRKGNATYAQSVQSTSPGVCIKERQCNICLVSLVNKSRSLYQGKAMQHMPSQSSQQVQEFVSRKGNATYAQSVQSTSPGVCIKERQCNICLVSLVNKSRSLYQGKTMQHMPSQSSQQVQEFVSRKGNATYAQSVQSTSPGVCIKERQCITCQVSLVNKSRSLCQGKAIHHMPSQSSQQVQEFVSRKGNTSHAQSVQSTSPGVCIKERQYITCLVSLVNKSRSLYQGKAIHHMPSQSSQQVQEFVSRKGNTSHAQSVQSTSPGVCIKERQCITCRVSLVNKSRSLCQGKAIHHMPSQSSQQVQEFVSRKGNTSHAQSVQSTSPGVCIKERQYITCLVSLDNKSRSLYQGKAIHHMPSQSSQQVQEFVSRKGNVSHAESVQSTSPGVCVKERQYITCLVSLVNNPGVCIKERQCIICLVQKFRNLYQGKAIRIMPSPKVQEFVSRKGNTYHAQSKSPGVCIKERQCIICLVQKFRNLYQGKAMQHMPSPKVQEFVSRKGNVSHAESVQSTSPGVCVKERQYITCLVSLVNKSRSLCQGKAIHHMPSQSSQQVQEFVSRKGNVSHAESVQSTSPGVCVKERQYITCLVSLVNKSRSLYQGKAMYHMPSQSSQQVQEFVSRKGNVSHAESVQSTSPGVCVKERQYITCLVSLVNKSRSLNQGKAMYHMPSQSSQQVQEFVSRKGNTSHAQSVQSTSPGVCIKERQCITCRVSLVNKSRSLCQGKAIHHMPSQSSQQVQEFVSRKGNTSHAKSVQSTSPGVCIKERQCITCQVSLVNKSRSLCQGKAMHHMPSQSSPKVQKFVSRKGNASYAQSKSPGVCIKERQCITCQVSLVNKFKSLCQGKAMHHMPSQSSQQVQEFVSRKGNASHAQSVQSTSPGVCIKERQCITCQVSLVQKSRSLCQGKAMHHMPSQSSQQVQEFVSRKGNASHAKSVQSKSPGVCVKERQCIICQVSLVNKSRSLYQGKAMHHMPSQSSQQVQEFVSRKGNASHAKSVQSTSPGVCIKERQCITCQVSLVNKSRRLCQGKAMHHMPSQSSQQVQEFVSRKGNASPVKSVQSTSPGVCIKERQYITCLVSLVNKSRSLCQGKAMHHMPSQSSPKVQKFVSRKGNASYAQSKSPGVCIKERQCITCQVSLVNKFKSLCQGKAMHHMPSQSSQQVQEFVSRKGNASHAQSVQSTSPGVCIKERQYITCLVSLVNKSRSLYQGKAMHHMPSQSSPKVQEFVSRKGNASHAQSVQSTSPGICIKKRQCITCAKSVQSKSPGVCVKERQCITCLVSLVNKSRSLYQGKAMHHMPSQSSQQVQEFVSRKGNASHAKSVQSTSPGVCVKERQCIICQVSLVNKSRSLCQGKAMHHMPSQSSQQVQEFVSRKGNASPVKSVQSTSPGVCIKERQYITCLVSLVNKSRSLYQGKAMHHMSSQSSQQVQEFVSRKGNASHAQSVQSTSP